MSADFRHAAIVETRLTVSWSDESATRAFASALAGTEQLSNAFVALHGDLGAGKTTFVRYLLQALGVQGRVRSPTYAIVESYELPAFPVWHFDFYRFNAPQEWEEAGFRDLFASDGLKLAEWPEKVATLLPPADLDIHITTGLDGTRSITMCGHSATGGALMQAVHTTQGAA